MNGEGGYCNQIQSSMDHFIQRGVEHCNRCVYGLGLGLGIRGHQTSLCTLGTQYIGTVRDESFADECRRALRARETIIVPMSIFK